MAKVLIVDDSETVLDFLSQFLRLKGYEVCCAESKNELDRNFLSFHPDIILLDVRLQGEDGRVICKEIKASIPDIPVILISAMESLLENHRLCDAADIISKPFNLEEVHAKIERALAAVG
jgi:DNA-binding response OmpR family regulator